MVGGVKKVFLFLVIFYWLLIITFFTNSTLAYEIHTGNTTSKTVIENDPNSDSSIYIKTSSSGGSDASVHVNSSVKSSSSTKLEQNNKTDIRVSGNGNVVIKITSFPQPTIYITQKSTLIKNATETFNTTSMPVPKPNLNTQELKNKIFARIKNKHLLGFIPVKIEIKQTVSVDGKIIKTQESFLAKLLDIFSF